MGKKSMAGFYTAAMAAVRQGDRKSMLKSMMPQRLEDGKLYNVNGTVIGSWPDAEDQEIIPFDRIENVSRVTEAFLTEIFSNVNQFLGTASEREELSDVEEADTVGDVLSDPEPGEDLLDETFDTGPIEKAIAKGKLKKAKALLEANKEVMDHDDYKALKKQIKKQGKQNG